MEGNQELEYLPVQVYSLLSIRSLFSIYYMTYDPGFVFAGESHDFWEFAMVISGEAVVTSEDSVYLCRQGEGILHEPNRFHSLRIEGDSPCKLFTISFDGTGLSSSLRSGQYNLTAGEQRCVHRILEELTLLFGEQDETEFTRFFSSASPDDVGFQIIKSHLELLCLSLVRRGDAARGLPSKDARSRTYARIVAFLRDHVEENLTLQDISRGIYESPAKIKELFRSFTGGGIIQYFNHLRCEHIMHLLSEGHSVKDIAETMGFSSPYYLSYFFKRETGMTARDYLKSREKDNV